MIEVETLVLSTRLTCFSIFTFCNHLIAFPALSGQCLHLSIRISNLHNVGILPGGFHESGEDVLGFHDSGENVCFKWVFRDSTLQTESAVN